MVKDGHRKSNFPNNNDMNAEFYNYYQANDDPRDHEQQGLPITVVPANDNGDEILVFKPWPVTLGEPRDLMKPPPPEGIEIQQVDPLDHFNKALAGNFKAYGKELNRKGYAMRKRILMGVASYKEKLNLRLHTRFNWKEAIREAQIYCDNYETIESTHMLLAKGDAVDAEMERMGIKKIPIVCEKNKTKVVGGRVLEADKTILPTTVLQERCFRSANMFDILMDECTVTDTLPSGEPAKVLRLNEETLNAKVLSLRKNRTKDDPAGKPIGLEEAATVIDTVKFSMLDAVTGELLPAFGEPNKVPKAKDHLNTIAVVASADPQQASDAFYSTEVSVGVQTNTDFVSCGTSTGGYKQRTMFRIPKRSQFKRYKTYGYIHADPDITYHLKSKYFMKRRDAATMQQMCSDARLFLLKKGHSMDNDEDYEKLTRGIMAAFLVDDAELEFRSRMKNPDNYDSLKHHNATLEGDLGLVFHPLGLPGETFGSSIKRATGLFKPMTLAKPSAMKA
jgi:hypothetical protein